MYKATIYVDFGDDNNFEFELEELETDDKSVIGDIAWEVLNDNMFITISSVEEM